LPEALASGQLFQKPSMNLRLQLLVALASAVTAILLPAANAAETAGVVLIKSPEAVITRSDWDADLEKIAPDRRDAFTSSPQRVKAVLNSLLVSKTFAARARAEGMDRDPRVADRIALEIDRLLAAYMMEKIERQAVAEFDRNREQNNARARELYLAEPNKYMLPEQVDVSHILFFTDKRSKADALAAAEAARAKLVAGANFAALAREVSEDASAKNGGRLSWLSRGATDPAFEKAAFALRSKGDLSEPVESSFGYHLIRLEGRKAARQSSFEEVRAKIIDELRKQFVSEARGNEIERIRQDSRLEVNQEAVEALVTKGGGGGPVLRAPAKK
jgi:peptidyl-prolyl cis-trans isomerase C